jgi:hypothetical protein
MPITREEFERSGTNLVFPKNLIRVFLRRNRNNAYTIDELITVVSGTHERNATSRLDELIQYKVIMRELTEEGSVVGKTCNSPQGLHDYFAAT